MRTRTNMPTREDTVARVPSPQPSPTHRRLHWDNEPLHDHLSKRLLYIVQGIDLGHTRELRTKLGRNFLAGNGLFEPCPDDRCRMVEDVKLIDLRVKQDHLVLERH